MKEKNYIIRIAILLVGTFVIAFGAALSIRSGLGTIPIFSVPYAYNFIFPAITVGQLSILLSLLLFVLQIVLLRKNFNPLYLFQILFILLFGWLIDMCLYLSSNINLSNYLYQWIMCLIGCAIIAFGIFLKMKAGICPLPGEGLIMAFSKTFKKDFAYTKIVFDSTLVAIAIVSTFLLSGKLQGVREGTVVSALLLGFILQFYQKHIPLVNKHNGLSRSTESSISEPYMTTDHFIITISREYGSGGHAVGGLIAKKLGVTFYDSKLIDMTAEESGFTHEFVEKNEQKLSNGLLYQFYKQNYAFVNEVDSPKDTLFMVQTKVIRDIAARESCVIVGRCADYILKGHPNCFNVFVHSDKTFRKNRVIADYGIPPEEAEKEIEKKDRERINYNKHYTHREWAEIKDYDMTIETSTFGIEITAAMIIDARRKAIYTRQS